MEKQNTTKTTRRGPHDLPDTGYVRIWQILGDAERPPIIPVSRSAWWLGVREGRFPQPVKLGKRTTCWRVDDIRKLAESGSAQ